MDNQLPAPSKFTGPKGIPIEAIIDLAEKNYSKSQIAKLLGCHPANIQKRLQDVELTKDYVNHRPFILQDLQRRIIQYITPAKLKKAAVNQLVWSYGVLYDKERLETGQSTQNIAYAEAIKARDQHKIQLDELREIHRLRHSAADSCETASLDSQGLASDANVEIECSR